MHFPCGNLKLQYDKKNKTIDRCSTQLDHFSLTNLVNNVLIVLLVDCTLPLP
jgi:hypothetical protein